MADVITIGEPTAGADGPDQPGLRNHENRGASTWRGRQELERLEGEHAGLDQARRELLETLELRTRRVNQLLGERDQLERQLVRAEAALQELNRKLGAAARPKASPAAPAPSLHQTFRGLLLGGLTRLRPKRVEIEAVARAQPQDQHSPPQDCSGPLIPFAQDGAARPVICFVAFGLAGDQRMSVLDSSLRFGADHGVVPLVLTDDDDFAPLRSRGMAFEYFPPRSAREARAPTLEWDLYLQRRLALIRRKWRPMRIIAFGKPAMLVVRLWSESPFEDPSLGALPAAWRPAKAPAASTEVNGAGGPEGMLPPLFGHRHAQQ